MLSKKSFSWFDLTRGHLFTNVDDSATKYWTVFCRITLALVVSPYDVCCLLPTKSRSQIISTDPSNQPL